LDIVHCLTKATLEGVDFHHETEQVISHPSTKVGSTAAQMEFYIQQQFQGAPVVYWSVSDPNMAPLALRMRKIQTYK
jgi:hypothetical protein